MANLMDRSFNENCQQGSCFVNNSIPCDLQNIIQQARQDPRGFEERIRQTNPQAYQQALQIRNMGNPRAAIMQMMQARGLNPSILRMFGL